MATIKRRPDSANWVACYTDHTGKRIQRTTKLPDKRAAAKLAEVWEQEASVPPPPPALTVEGWRDQWLAGHKGAVSVSTYSGYSSRTLGFLTYLGARAKEPLMSITKADVVAYRTVMLQRITPMTANLGIKILRMFFEAARRDDLLAKNPAEGIKALRDEGRVHRRPFTLDEIGTLLEHATGEMRSLILFGIYTGQRLNDIGLFRWGYIDSTAGEIRFTSRKTGRQMSIPIAAPLARHLAGMVRPKEGGAAFVHPESAGSIQAGESGRASTLSGQFRELLVEAGLRPPLPHRKATTGRDAKRDLSDISFHSFRHTATSMMKNAGVSEAVVMDIIGHDSPAVSAMYTHIDSAAKRTALDAMPDLF
jgi:integrase